MRQVLKGFSNYYMIFILVFMHKVHKQVQVHLPGIPAIFLVSLNTNFPIKSFVPKDFFDIHLG